MTRHAMIAATLLSAAATTPASAATASLRLWAVIPVSCTIDILDTQVIGRSVIVSLHRACNAAHDVTVAGQYSSVLGSVSLQLGSRQRDATGNYASIDEPEAFYDGIDTLVLSSQTGSTDDLVRYANTLSIGVETR